MYPPKSAFLSAEVENLSANLHPSLSSNVGWRKNFPIFGGKTFALQQESTA
jgi:hypothetical protein